MSSPFASPSRGGWNYLSSWLGGTSAQKASASQEDDETPQQPAAKRRKTEGEPETTSTSTPTASASASETASASASETATPTSTSTSTSTAPTLEQVMEAIREHTTKAQEHKARAEERERLAKARAERIESLLERVLEKLNDAAAVGTEATGVAIRRRRRNERAEDEDEDEDEDKDEDDDEDQDEDQDENQDEEESGDEDEDEDENTTSEVSASASLNTPARGTSQKYVPRSSGSSGKTWTMNEREVVVKGVAVYGKDFKAVSHLLKYRNYDQTRGFFRRNDDYIERESSKYPCSNKTDKQALLEAIGRIDQDDNGPEEDSSDDDDGETMRSGIWSQREFALAAKGLAIHGLNDFDAIAAIVRTRTPVQTKRYVIRRYHELREVAQEE